MQIVYLAARRMTVSDFHRGGGKTPPPLVLKGLIQRSKEFSKDSVDDVDICVHFSKITCLLRSKPMPHLCLHMIEVAIDHSPLALQCPKVSVQFLWHLQIDCEKQFQKLLGHGAGEILLPRKKIIRRPIFSIYL